MIANDGKGKAVENAIVEYVYVQRMSTAIPLLPHYAFVAWCSVKAQG
jgi:hypothetical protein